jgi:hypothetical protein
MSRSPADDLLGMKSHELDGYLSSLGEKSPPGWSGTVKAMKKHKDIKNPFALAWSMKKKGAKPHYKPEASMSLFGQPYIPEDTAGRVKLQRGLSFLHGLHYQNAPPSIVAHGKRLWTRDDQASMLRGMRKYKDARATVKQYGRFKGGHKGGSAAESQVNERQGGVGGQFGAIYYEYFSRQNYGNEGYEGDRNISDPSSYSHKLDVVGAEIPEPSPVDYAVAARMAGSGVGEVVDGLVSGAIQDEIDKIKNADGHVNPDDANPTSTG